MKKLFLGTCVLLALGVFAACGKAASNETTASNMAAQAVDYSRHETFTAWLYSTPNDYYSSYSENPIVQYLENKYNITLDFQQPSAGTEADSLSLMFGTGEYTDIIEMSTFRGSLSDLYDEGVIIDIAPYLDYMPNFKNLIETDDNFRKTSYNDSGRILSLRLIATEVEFMWGGLVYRRDILETITGGNIRFPGGKGSPTTIEDWEYMLPLFKSYFEAAGIKDYAPLILPFNGLSTLISGFGVTWDYYLDGNTVKYSPLESGFYNYIKKMNEWYAKGYIYKDFASRVNDPIYLPNTSLTYGGAAGIWFGIQSQLEDAMSMPEYGLFFDVQPISDPLDTANGVTEALSLLRPYYYDDGTKGWVITKNCKNIPKLLSALDYMYSPDGGKLKVYGLTKEQGADKDPIYLKADLTDGTYWFENGKMVFNPLTTPGGGSIDDISFVDMRLPGLFDRTLYRDTVDERIRKADRYWTAYRDTEKKKMPSALYYPPEDDRKYTENQARIMDVMANLPKFIMGTTPLNDATWEEFKNQLKAYGAEENHRIQQAAYDRYLKR
jgi:putative aldouronate transport system substrate-binding protein